MKAALVGAADFNASDFKSRSFDMVIAVDGGLQSCAETHRAPDLVIGDFDSLGFIPEGANVLQFPQVKNESDLELACFEAMKRGADELYMYGAFSGRLDHTFAAIQVMAGAARHGVKAVGIGEDLAIVALVGGTAHASLQFDAVDPTQLTGSYAPYISLMALAGVVRGLGIEGLAYTVDKFELSAEVSRGLSNEFVGQPASIHFGEGVLIVMFPLDALNFAHF